MQPVRHVITVHYTEAWFQFECLGIRYLNSLQGGHLSKVESSFGPKGVYFRELTVLLLQYNQVPNRIPCTQYWLC